MDQAECLRCGRKLRTAKSIEDGMGKTCKRKSVTEKAMMKIKGGIIDDTTSKNEN